MALGLFGGGLRFEVSVPRLSLQQPHLVLEVMNCDKNDSEVKYSTHYYKLMGNILY